MSIMLIMSCNTGFFNVRRGWQFLNTGPRFYLRLIRRTGWLWISTSRTTDGRPFKPRKLSVPFLYPGVPAGFTESVKQVLVIESYHTESVKQVLVIESYHIESVKQVLVIESYPTTVCCYSLMNMFSRIIGFSRLKSNTFSYLFSNVMKTNDYTKQQRSMKWNIKINIYFVQLYLIMNKVIISIKCNLLYLYRVVMLYLFV